MEALIGFFTVNYNEQLRTQAIEKWNDIKEEAQVRYILPSDRLNLNCPVLLDQAKGVAWGVEKEGPRDTGERARSAATF